MRKIQKIEIEKLFDRFNYSIDFNDEIKNGLSIITAPNGYGKTTILKLMLSFSRGDFASFFVECFKKITFYLSDNKIVCITKKDEDELVVVSKNSEFTIKKDNFMSNIDQIHRMIDRYIPHVRRISDTLWRDLRFDDVITLFELVDRYKENSFIKRRLQKKEEWIDDITDKLKVFSISTNRLRYTNDGSELSMVNRIAKEIQIKMEHAIRTQFEQGRKQETSFPTRIMRELSQNKDFPKKDKVLDLINKLHFFEKRYSYLGLIPNTDTMPSSVSRGVEEGAGLLVLKTYMEDVVEKLTLLEDLAKKLDIFITSINSLLTFKEVRTTVEDGITVYNLDDSSKSNVKLDTLSSGEQHLIILVGRIVFEADENTTVLIDEPEISFHPEWQEKFMSILNDIRNMNKFDVVLATHSPIIIGEDYWEHVIELSDLYVNKQ